MKRYLFILSLFFAVSTYAQIATRTTSTKLDQNAVVKDGSGTILPYAIWQKLLQTGTYQLKKETDATDFLIYQMSPTEKLLADERKKAQAANMAKPRPAFSFKEGEKFRGEKITDMNGNKYDLKVLTDKIYVLNFWFINCPPCKQEIPELNQLVSKYKENKDVVFIAIALDDKTQLKEFLKFTPFNYNIVDEGQYYSKKYSVDGYPTHVIVGKDGLIKFSTIGLASNTIYWVDKTIKEQLSGT